MRRHPLFTTALAAAGLCFATAAAADCAAELDALAGLSKDGSTAPLAGEATPQTGGTAAGDPPEGATDGVSKDGTMMPLGESPDIATSGQDAQAQSQGGETAAAQAAGAEGGDSPQAAIDEARAALAAGDEDACMAAVERAKAM